MFERTSVKKNVLYQTLYDTLSMIIPFIISPYIARVLGPDGLGVYSFYYSVAFYFTLVAALGIKNYGNRTIAKCRYDKHKLDDVFSNLLSIQVIMSTICLAAYLLFLVFFANPGEKTFATIMIIQVASAFFDISWFYFGIEHFKLTVVINAIIKTLTLFSVFFFVKTTGDLWLYCLIMSLGILTGQLALWIPLSKYVSFTRPSTCNIHEHIKPLFVLFIPTIAVSLYKYMDKIMIGLLSNKAQLGYYENADKLVSLPLTIIASFGTVMIPRMSTLVSGDDSDKVKRYTDFSMYYVMWLAYALTFGLASVAKVFAPVYWGKAFAVSGYVIVGLSVTIPFISFANIIRTQYLIPREKDREYVVSVSGGAISNLVLNFFLIPLYGAFGATVATIVAEVTVCLIQCLYVRNEMSLGIYIRRSLPFFIFGITMFVIVFMIGSILETSVLTVIIQVLCGLAIYAVESIIYLYSVKEPYFMSTVNRLKGSI